MKKTFILMIMTVLILTGCSYNLNSEVNTDVSSTYPIIQQENTYTPLNFEKQRATWFPYVDFPEYMQGRTEDEFTAAITEMLTEASQNGINTIYFHIHPEGDAYYNSEIYPKGQFNDDDYDPLKIVLDVAHSMNISVHGWINPYRMQTAEKMETLPDSYIVKQWIDTESPMVILSDNRWYLNPIYHAVNHLLSQTVQEIIENYEVDGIHIDDYFYPKAVTEIDLNEFYSSKGSVLEDWRREKITEMVQTLYNTVKSYDSRLKFGISPQGNIDADYNTQYADVELWTRNTGYADYIVPQIYYGFENEVCPFEETLSRWEEFAENGNVDLIIGLARYKEGKYDKWAGISGENEWIENDDIIKRQTELVNASEISDGYALYR